ncbi:MAG: hypothetical protein Q4B86_03540 [Eubacteriales bacterium]|nr:hypothetical protein [Eubacteriales bacterium]
MKIVSLIKNMITVAAMTLMISAEAFAAPTSINDSTAFPFDIELSDDSCERLTYAGHSSNGVSYEDGTAITPYTQFRIIRTADESYDIDKLDIEIYVLYENDKNTGHLKEFTKKYSGEDLTVGDEYYDFFSENLRDNLESRDRLYSNSLRSLVMKLSYEGREVKAMKKYFYVCNEEDFDALLQSSDDIVYTDEDSAEFLEL